MTVDGPEYETVAGIGSNCGIWDAHAVLEANFYCDTYGIDTISFGTGLAFAMECYEAGILNKKITGGLELNFGNGDAMLELLHQIGRGEGFGVIVGQGIRRMKQIFAEQYGADPQFLQDIGMECQGAGVQRVRDQRIAGPAGRLRPGHQGAAARRGLADLHGRRQQPDPHLRGQGRGAALLSDVAHLVRPERPVQAALERRRAGRQPGGLQRHPGRQGARSTSRIMSTFFRAITGRTDVRTGDDLVAMSERVYNFQRLFNLKMGYGTREHDAIPYRSVGPVTDKEYESRAERYDKQLRDLAGIDPAGMTTDEKRLALRRYREDQYEKLIDAVYKRRGWNERGIPTLQKVRELGIDYPDVVALIEKHS